MTVSRPSDSLAQQGSLPALVSQALLTEDLSAPTQSFSDTIPLSQLIREAALREAGVITIKDDLRIFFVELENDPALLQLDNDVCQGLLTGVIDSFKYLIFPPKTMRPVPNAPTPEQVLVSLEGSLRESRMYFDYRQTSHQAIVLKINYLLEKLVKICSNYKVGERGIDSCSYPMMRIKPLAEKLRYTLTSSTSSYLAYDPGEQPLEAGSASEQRPERPAGYNRGPRSGTFPIDTGFVPHSKPGDSGPGDSVSSDSKPSDSKPGDSRPGDSGPGDSGPTSSFDWTGPSSGATGTTGARTYAA